MDDEKNRAYAEAIERLNDGENAQAIEAFHRALELEPDRARIHSNLAFAMSQEGRSEEALPIAERGCELAPEDPYPRLKRADVLGALERYDEALADQERARELARKSDDEFNFGIALIDIGWTLLQLDRSREAIPVARDAMRHDPADAGPFGLLAGALADLDRWGEALEAIEQGLALEPDNEWLAERRDLCAQGVERILPMVETFEADIGPDSSWEQWHELGCARLACGQLEKAAAAFDEAHLRHPEGDRREEAGMLSSMEADCRLALLEREADSES